MPDGIILKKSVNVLVANPEMSGLWSAFSWGSWGMLDCIIRRFQRLSSGLWTGGTLLVYREKISFRPNALNRIFLKSDETIEFSTASITAITPRFGVVTGIVEIIHNGDSFVFRCFGSKKVAKLIATILKAV